MTVALFCFAPIAFAQQESDATVTNSEADVVSLIAEFRDQDANVRRDAVGKLVAIGEAAVPQLLARFVDADRDEARYMLDALTEIGAPAVAPLAPLLTNGPDSQRIRYLSVVQRFGPLAAGILDSVLPLVTSENADVRQQAVQAVGKIGPSAEKAVPALIEALSKPDRYPVITVYLALEGIGPGAVASTPAVLSSVQTAPAHAKSAAVRAILACDNGSEAALPLLLEMAQTGDAKAVCALARYPGRIQSVLPKLVQDYITTQEYPDMVRAIGGLGKDALPYVVRLLKDNHPFIRMHAVQAIGAAGPDAAEVIPDLAALLQDSYSDVRLKAAEALGDIGPASMPVLLTALRSSVEGDTEYPVTQILQALGKLRPASRDFISIALNTVGTDKEAYDTKTILATFGKDTIDAVRPILMEFVRQEHTRRDTNHVYPRKQIALVDLLVLIGSDSVPLLANALIWESDRIMTSSAGSASIAGLALGRIGEPSVPVLLQLVQLPDDGVRCRAAAALGAVGTAAQEAAPILAKYVASENPQLAARASEALQSIGSNDPDVVAALLNHLQQGSTALCRASAATALAHSGGREVCDALVLALADPDREVRYKSLRAIARRSKSPCAPPTAITVFLDDNNSGEPELAFGMLCNYDELPPSIAPELLAIVQNEKAELYGRAAAANVLARMNSDAAESVSVLIEILVTADSVRNGTTDRIRKTAIEALGLFGSASTDAVDELKGWTACDNREVRRAAVEALGRIAPYSDKAVTVLKKLAAGATDANSTDGVHGAAARALAQIRTVLKVGTIVKNQIVSEHEGSYHFEFQLRLDTDLFFLGRQYKRIKQDEYFPKHGFDEDTIIYEWLEPERLLHISWRTCPMGQGTNTRQTHLLLLKVGQHWHQIFRDTQDFYSRGGPFLRYSLQYAPDTKTLTVLETDLSGPNGARYEAEPNESNEVLTPADVVYETEWRFRIVDARLEYLGGKRSIDVDDRRSSHVYEPELDKLVHRSFAIKVVAEFLTPNDVEPTIARLQRLNPALQEGGTCSGQVLIDDAVQWRGADEKHYYSMEE